MIKTPKAKAKKKRVDHLSSPNKDRKKEKKEKKIDRPAQRKLAHHEREHLSRTMSRDQEKMTGSRGTSLAATPLNRTPVDDSFPLGASAGIYGSNPL